MTGSDWALVIVVLAGWAGREVVLQFVQKRKRRR
jgi:hypothetical protein